MDPTYINTARDPFISQELLLPRSRASPSAIPLMKLTTTTRSQWLLLLKSASHF
jgi:hypothetical protein